MVQVGSLGGRQSTRAKMPVLTEQQEVNPMEAERINQIEANLADLSARTQDLRRYL